MYSKETSRKTFTYNRTWRAFFGLGDLECVHWDYWGYVSSENRKQIIVIHTKTQLTFVSVKNKLKCKMINNVNIYCGRVYQHNKIKNENRIYVARKIWKCTLFFEQPLYINFDYLDIKWGRVRGQWIPIVIGITLFPYSWYHKIMICLTFP